jgi:hypothetical protein
MMILPLAMPETKVEMAATATVTATEMVVEAVATTKMETASSLLSRP